MKILEIIKEKLAILGINSTESSRFNLKVSMGFILFALSIISIVMLIFSLENVTLMDYMESFNILSVLALLGFCLIVIVLKKMELLAFFEKMEILINKSKLICLHTKKIPKSFTKISRIDMHRYKNDV